LNEDLTKGLKKGKPFLDRVWSTISHFQTTISDKTKLELSGHISPEVIIYELLFSLYLLNSYFVTQKAACCFISLSILDKLDTHSLVKEFIILRSNMLQHSLTEGSSVEKNIENSCDLIINTIYNLYLCFTSKIMDILTNIISFVVCNLITLLQFMIK